MGVALRFNKQTDKFILFDVLVDDVPRWNVAILDERPDLETDPTFAVWDEDNMDGGEPILMARAR